MSPARIWNLHETGCQAALAARLPGREARRPVRPRQEFPLGYLRKHSFVHETRPGQCGGCSLFGISSIDSFQTRGSRVPLHIAGPPSGATTPIIWPAWLRARPSGLQTTYPTTTCPASWKRLFHEIRALTQSPIQHKPS